jgi:hypothetical protein
MQSGRVGNGEFGVRSSELGEGRSQMKETRCQKQAARRLRTTLNQHIDPTLSGGAPRSSFKVRLSREARIKNSNDQAEIGFIELSSMIKTTISVFRSEDNG